MQLLKVIISGGGTGGHIFPAIAIANALKKKVKNIDILFAGAKGKMEMEKVPEAGYKIEGLWISGLQRNMTVRNLLFPLKLISSLIKANKIINRFNPDIVIGTGGYASGPMLYMAALKRIPALIQEQNSFPGITNKLLAKKVNKICVSYPGMEVYFPKEKIILTGNPVREDIIDIEGKREQAIQHFGLSSKKKTALIIGGSQGAKSINESITQGFSKLMEENIQLIWQTGKNSIETISKVYEFITRMDLAYAAADIVISRAGAIAVAELCLVKKPVILVPFPFAAEDHQTKNALSLVEKNAAIMIKDGEAKEKLVAALIRLIKDEDKQKQLSENISAMALKDAACVIADEALSMININ